MKASAKVQQRLFDHSIEITGRDREVIHFFTQEDKYGNETREIIANKKTITRISYPTEVPIERLHTGDYQLGTQENRTFFFDLLPIEMYTKWADKVEKGDYIVDFLYTEKNKKFPIVLKTSEFLGRFSTDLIWAKWYCSPYRGILPEEIKTYIQGILNE